jgi:hypothetical protein
MIAHHKWTTLSFTGCIAAAAAFVLPSPASATSCGPYLDRTQIAIDAALVKHANAVPSAPESVFAKLSHQPTPATIARAESEYGGWANGANAIAALKRARAADSAGDAKTCFLELRAARRAVAGP